MGQTSSPAQPAQPPQLAHQQPFRRQIPRRDWRRIKTLQADIQALVALAAKNEASLTALQSRLEKAQLERLPAEWSYALMALLAACLAAMAYFWKLQSGSRLTGAAATATFFSFAPFGSSDRFSD